MSLKIIQQQLADARIDHYIESEAFRLFNQYMSIPDMYIGTKNVGKAWFPVVRPYGAYMVYNDETAKHLNLDLHTEVMKRVNQKIELSKIELNESDT